MKRIAIQPIIRGMEIDLTKPAPRVQSLAEAQALIDTLWALLRTQAKRIEALEEKLNANSHNSSKPPSTDQGKGVAPTPRPGSGKKAGGQAGHAGKARELFAEEDITHFYDCHPARHCACGGIVDPTHLCGRHQVVDLPAIEPEVTQYRLYAGLCRRCGRQHEATLPPGVSRRLAGPRLLALIGTLTGGYRLSKRLTQGLLQDLFHIDLSVGTISQGEAILSEVLAPVVREAHAYVQRAPIVHADETSHKERGGMHWMWVAIAALVSVFLARPTRSGAVARELLGPGFAGILVSDRFAAYHWIAAQRRQMCWAHLMRDFTKMAERSGTAGPIGEELLAHTQRIFGFWYCVRDGTLSRDGFASQMHFLRAQVEAALRRGSTCGEAKTAHTCRNLLKHQSALWTFVDTPGVEPTNNLAERTLRSYVMWRKISFGAQSKRGSLYMGHVMTVVGSCKLQGRNILDFLTQAVLAQAGNGPMPSLLPVAAR